jgi:hypothetical protein
VLPADTATVLAYMAHHNTAEQMRANIWRAVLIRIVTALVESRCQITPVDVTTLARIIHESIWSVTLRGCRPRLGQVGPWRGSRG